MILDLFAGPGGWDEAARQLGLPDVAGVELDTAACETRAAAGHATVRANVAALPIAWTAAARSPGRVEGLIASPPCVVFSGAGNRAGVTVTGILGDAIRDAFHGGRRRAARRREMARALRAANWPPQKLRASRHNRECKTPTRLTRAQRSAAIRSAVMSASLVTEPARYIAACRPEWVAMEQVPSVLPLWRVYADELRALGYSVWCGKLNAADYGVPQTRERAILIASRVRRVERPVPTHYDPRKGGMLWGAPWVSMAEALGFGASARPSPVVTAGGTATGGAEPFGHRDRDMLATEREAGRWELRIDAQSRSTCRPVDLPADTIKGAHSSADMRWVLHTNRGQAEDGSRQTRDPHTAPAPALTAKSGGQWKVKPDGDWKLRNNSSDHAAERSTDEPAPTLFFGGRSNWAAWVHDRPSTTVLGEARIGRPGHKGRESGGESNFAVDSVRISVQEAAILQGFPPDYPWKGVRTRQFQQVGNAIPPPLAAAILSVAAGVRATATSEPGAVA